MAQKIQIRRGVEAQRTSITPDAGEPLFTVDGRKLFIGDGATAGGVFIGPVRVDHVAGTVAMGSGADSVSVTGLALTTTPLQVLVTVRKPAGGLNLFATVRGDSLSTDGFIADLSGETDGDAYQLDYLVML